MKLLLPALVLMFLTTPAFANVDKAVQFPEVYCVSTRSFEFINQINIFTNQKGTMRISIQYYATDGQNEGNFDSANLHTVTRLNYDKSTGMMANRADKVQFLLDNKPISPANAEKMFAERSAHTFDLMNLPGHKLDFKRYYLGKMVDYNLPGRSGYWTEDLMKAFRSGVTEYVCGRREDIKGRRPSIFDGLDD